MKTKQPTKLKQPCGECGQMLDDTQFVFHPFLYCLLYKRGVRNQEQYLRDSGFVRDVNYETQRARADAAERERDAAYASLKGTS